MESKLAILLILLSTTHLLISVQAQNATLIDQTCQKTPDFSLCSSTLYSDPQSRWATEMRGLATILVFHVRDKATQTRDHISGLLNDPSMDQPRKQLLSKCFDRYNTILINWLRETIEGLSNKDYGFARDSMSAVPTNVELCERSFQGSVKSPISDDSKATDDLAKVAYAVVLYLYMNPPPPLE